MATRQEIEDLKAQWRADPCWDIADTEGMEEHREELAAYQREVEFQAFTTDVADLEELAEVLGCPGNIRLARRIRFLERRLAALEAKL